MKQDITLYLPLLCVPIFCLLCIFMVYNDYVNKGNHSLVEVVVVLPDGIYKTIDESKVIDGAKKKQFAKKDKQGKKTVSPCSNEPKNF